MTFEQFHNALRILLNIDRDKMEYAGIIDRGDLNAWGEFRRNPFRWFICVPDEKAKKLFSIIKERL